MGSRHAWLFPAVSFLLLPLAFFVSYGIAVKKNDVEKVWPYISDTGALPPESCVFGQLLNMSAGFMMVSIYLRHRQVMAYFRRRPGSRSIVISSRIFLCVGLIATFGLMVVANFQEQNVKSVHFLGAFTSFSLGVLYGWYQSAISFLSPPELTPRWLAIFRLIISIFGTIFFVGLFSVNMAGLDITSMSPLRNVTINSDTPKIYHLGPDDPGYEILLVTTISEWCLGACLALFFLTLALDMKGTKLRAMKLELPGCTDPVDSSFGFSVTALKTTPNYMLPEINEINVQRTREGLKMVSNGDQVVAASEHQLPAGPLVSGDYDDRAFQGGNTRRGLRRAYEAPVYSDDAYAIRGNFEDVRESDFEVKNDYPIPQNH